MKRISDTYKQNYYILKTFLISYGCLCLILTLVWSKCIRAVISRYYYFSFFFFIKSTGTGKSKNESKQAAAAKLLMEINSDDSWCV